MDFAFCFLFVSNSQIFQIETRLYRNIYERKLNSIKIFILVVFSQEEHFSTNDASSYLTCPKPLLSDNVCQQGFGNSI